MKKTKVEELPNALEKKEQINAFLDRKKPALFLDYDGTLTPIVPNPEDANLTEENRELISGLSDLIPLIIISGRDLQDVKSKVALSNVTYAGSHGFDISGPDFKMAHESEKEITPALDRAQESLSQKIGKIPGVKVERKKYAIAVHYRNAKDEDIPEVKEAVDQEIKGQTILKKGSGKKILELKPNLDWHKGRALNWLCEKLGLDQETFLPVYIGDDITDEDAFATIENKGIGVLVGSHGEETSASFHLKNTDEVTEFLKQLKSDLEQ